MEKEAISFHDNTSQIIREESEFSTTEYNCRRGITALSGIGSIVKFKNINLSNREKNLPGKNNNNYIVHFVQRWKILDQPWKWVSFR